MNNYKELCEVIVSSKPLGLRGKEVTDCDALTHHKDTCSILRGRKIDLQLSEEPLSPDSMY